MRAKALTLVLAVIMSVLADESETRIEVSIVEGRLSGLKEVTAKGRPFYSFRNIPFAKPPVGDLRFKDPEPAEGWEGTRDASAYPPRCIQQPIELMFLGYRAVAGEEDCLYLNVYTPKVDVSARLPVMVFIHGGAFFAGDSSLYPPQILLERDVVLVVPQYRLGIFGFLSTEDSVIPGNFGLKDQTLALRWVQQNVAAFGGDPSRVTLFGQSAGAAAAHFHMLIPEAKGLFSQVIMQSGSALNVWAVEMTHAQVARRIARTMGCSEDAGSQELLECLQRAPADDLVTVATNEFKWMINPLVMAPRVDGTYIPDSPGNLVASGRFHKVPVMSGVTRDEGAFITNYIYSDDKIRQEMNDDFALIPLSMEFKGPDDAANEAQARRILDTFLGGVAIKRDNADLLTQVYGDLAFLVGNDVTSLVHSRHHPVYTYQLNHRGQRSFGDSYDSEFSSRWISHGDELLYLFEDGPIFPPLELEEDIALRDIMVALWTNFASTGDPTPDNSLGFKWDMVSEQSYRYLSLQPQPSMKDDTRQKRREFWLELPTLEQMALALQTQKKDEL